MRSADNIEEVRLSLADLEDECSTWNIPEVANS
jgi:hypothetical protein